MVERAMRQGWRALSWVDARMNRLVGWRMNPLRTRKVWRDQLGLEESVPFEHLTSAQQDRLHRFCRRCWRDPDNESPRARRRRESLLAARGGGS